MRVLTFVVGGLLLIAGACAVVIADLERTAAVEQAQADLLVQQARLDAALTGNRALAVTLSGLRAVLAEQDAQLADTDGFIE